LTTSGVVDDDVKQMNSGSHGVPATVDLGYNSAIPPFR
jgi:hypothetical protein